MDSTEQMINSIKRRYKQGTKLRNEGSRVRLLFEGHDRRVHDKKRVRKESKTFLQVYSSNDH